MDFNNIFQFIQFHTSEETCITDYLFLKPLCVSSVSDMLMWL